MPDELSVIITLEQAAQFLDRIGLSEEAGLLREGLAADPGVSPLEPTKELLDKMVLAHQLAVPFENLEIFDLGKPVELATEKLFDKIVTRRRGGYCFEMNKNFMNLLQALGYVCTAHLGRIHMMPVLRQRLHRVTLVYFGGLESGERYLVDVGQGGMQPASGSLLVPGPFTDQVGASYSLSYGAVDHSIGIRENSWLLSRVTDEGEQPMVSFEADAPQYEVDFVPPNYFTSTHPDSRFTGSRIVNQRRLDGHASVTDDLFKLIKDGETTEIDVSDPKVRAEVLEEYFGIVL